MGGIRSIVVESDIESDAEKTYHMIKHYFHHLPEIFPETYKGSEIIKGDGTGNGCVRIWKYILPGSEEILFVKCKNEDVDHDKMTIALNVIDGDELKYYKHLVARITVTPKDNGCLVKWELEYEKVSDDAPIPVQYMTMFAGVNAKLDSHIIQKS